MFHKIEKNVPMLPPGHRSYSYPFLKDMDIGDSFLVPLKDIVKVRNAVQFLSKKSGRKFESRTLENGVRTWRVS